MESNCRLLELRDDLVLQITEAAELDNEAGEQGATGATAGKRCSRH